MFAQPIAELQPYVQRIWYAAANQDCSYQQLPDGAVDLVIEMMPGQHQASWYGTSTRAVWLPVRAGADYLGVRFWPGQSRHFHSISAAELTDSTQCQQLVPGFQLQSAAMHQPVIQLQQQLLAYLQQHPPQRHWLDPVLATFHQPLQQYRISELAKLAGKSSRQLERQCQLKTGVSLKLLASIRRFQYARGLLLQGESAVAVALEAGYYDQSHFSHAFKRFCGQNPGSMSFFSKKKA